MSFTKSPREEMLEDLNLIYDCLSDEDKRCWLRYEEWGDKDQRGLYDSIEVNCLTYSIGWDLG